MNREFFLQLAAGRQSFPIGTDLVLHGHDDAAAVILDGARLGMVLAENADMWGTPLAIPLMDLTLEKQAMLTAMGFCEKEIPTFHFCDGIEPEAKTAYEANRLNMFAAHPRLSANIGGVEWIAKNRPDLVACAMSIGPFSLATKLLSDPITPVYMAGMGDAAEDNEEVALFEDVLHYSLQTVLASVRLQLSKGAQAVFIAEPAANLVYFSPKQLEAGADTFERYVMQPNRQLCELIHNNGAQLIFHCCGELNPQMVREFGALEPAILSLGSSRRLWEDAQLVPNHVVLYGNLPSKRFPSEELTTDMVRVMALDLREKMQQTGHPFLLGTECDVLSVAGKRKDILEKVRAFMAV